MSQRHLNTHYLDSTMDVVTFSSDIGFPQIHSKFVTFGSMWKTRVRLSSDVAVSELEITWPLLTPTHVIPSMAGGGSGAGKKESMDLGIPVPTSHHVSWPNSDFFPGIKQGGKVVGNSSPP